MLNFEYACLKGQLQISWSYILKIEVWRRAKKYEETEKKNENLLNLFWKVIYLQIFKKIFNNFLFFRCKYNIDSKKIKWTHMGVHEQVGYCSLCPYGFVMNEYFIERRLAILSLSCKAVLFESVTQGLKQKSSFWQGEKLLPPPYFPSLLVLPRSKPSLNNIFYFICRLVCCPSCISRGRKLVSKSYKKLLATLQNLCYILYASKIMVHQISHGVKYWASNNHNDNQAPKCQQTGPKFSIIFPSNLTEALHTSMATYY